MLPLNIFRRTLTTERVSISNVFFREDVQQLLKEVTRFDENKLFARRQVSKLKSPKFIFMTDAQLEKAKKDAYENVQAKLQMPPVLEPNNEPPAVLARDEEIVGYTNCKIMFIDITPGQTNKSRLMSVRESDGTLRYPNHDERSRLNHIFYPQESRTIDPPKLFEDKYLQGLLQRRQYVYILDRACIQFEPDDPRYVAVTSKVYDYIDEGRDYDHLRSTRHFGPMCLYLAYNKRADNLMSEMTSKGYKEDAEKLVKLCKICQEPVADRM